MNKTNVAESVTLRFATAEDIPVLEEFEQGVIATERPFDATLKESPIRYYDLPQLISSDQSCVVVAVTGSRIVGSGYARIEESKPYLKHSQHAYLGFMFVHKDFRGQGINQRIMEELIAWSRHKGLTEVRLDVYLQNRSAIRAYEKAGFSGHMIQMRRGI